MKKRSKKLLISLKVDWYDLLKARQVSLKSIEEKNFEKKEAKKLLISLKVDWYNLSIYFLTQGLK